MDWNALGALGELLGAVAVVASLLYVARQVRQSNRIARADAYRSAMMKMADTMENWCQDGAWATQFVKLRFQGLRREDMDPTERAKAGIHVQSLLWMFSAIHRDVELGILPPSAYEIVAAGTFQIPYMKEVWPILRGEHSEEFAQFFEARFGLSRASDSVDRLPPGAEASEAKQ